jgi:acetyl-CoA acyltransferase
MKTAYIVKAYRTAVGKAPKGVFRFKRPDELAAETIQFMMNELPDFDKKRIDDVMVGNAMPEAEQGLNVGRLISLMGLKIETFRCNRKPLLRVRIRNYWYATIKSIWNGGLYHCRWSKHEFYSSGRLQTNSGLCCCKSQTDYYWGMGLTAEAVAKQFNVSRADQMVAYQSHESLKAQTD